MSAREETAWQAGADASEVLGPEGSMFAQLDPVDFGSSVLSVLGRAAGRPDEVRDAWLRFATAMAEAWPAAVGRWLGEDGEPPVPVDDRDKRFADPAWDGNPGYFALRQAYLAARRLGEDLLAAGVRNFLSDVVHNNGRPRQVDTTPFELGRNLAATPGKVVFRNDLMELIQYAPQTKQVHSVPLLASPPWINKYYIMDLAPGRSFLEWAVQHRRTVFAISYRNPDASMSGVTLDDYIIHGPKTALDV